MSINWGPNFIVPSEVAKDFSGIVVLRENFDEGLLRTELKNLGLDGAVVRVIKIDNQERMIARQNIVEVTLRN